MKNNSQNTNAFLLHISSFTGYLFPLGHIVTPLILWQTQKNKNSFLDAHGKEAINFNISYSIYLFILSTSLLSFSIGDISNLVNNIDLNFNIYSNRNKIFDLFSITTLTSFLSIIKITLIIIAAMKANEGESYQYPFTINFIK